MCCRQIRALEVVLSGFFSSIGIYYSHKVTSEMEARAEEILEFLEISHLADRLMCELSTGEARRVLIGRALVHDLQALILDEPANSLDLKAMHSFRESVRKIACSEKSVILITHNLGRHPGNQPCGSDKGRESLYGRKKRRSPDR